MNQPLLSGFAMDKLVPRANEEERRLLREYRIASIPPRRSSHSPATSNASSYTTSDNLSEQQLQKPRLLTASFASTIPKQGINSNQMLNHQLRDCIRDDTVANKIPETRVSCDSKIKSRNAAISASTSTNSTTTEIAMRNDLHGTQKRHKHNSNHRDHKNHVQIDGLKPEELMRILDLVSNLDCLKLVSPQSVPPPKNDTIDGSNDDKVTKSADSRENYDRPVRKNKVIVKGADRRLMESSKYMLNHNCSDPTASSDCRTYIFEKVDYIKKMSIRRKEMKKLRKGRIKSSSDCNIP